MIEVGDWILDRLRSARLVYWRWAWRRYWDRHTGLLYDAEAVGLSPCPPDLHRRGERACDLAARLRHLHQSCR